MTATKTFRFFLIALAAVCCLLFAGCNQEDAAPPANDLVQQTEQTMGVWWWNSELGDEFLEFAAQNGVNEIYYDDSALNSETFIQKANAKGIKVFWLIGDVRWLRDSSGLFEKMQDYLAYNATHPNAAYSGVHLDVEPVQDDNFDTDRELLFFNLISLASELKAKYPDVHFSFDIHFWMDDEITFNGETKPGYAHMIDIADKIFVMSYRDSAEGMLSVAEEELEYAKAAGKPLVLGAETAETDEVETVTYFEEGKTFMNEQLSLVKQTLPQNFGISIHHIYSWFMLQD